ncbi:TetR/AcrR family transcriptional regulator [Lacibacterium aquatile]|uniref:TetR/AcrR family transcriptional regulator n=1 Tax=Lacibacterium aquatile TaxID=1168082 RepID=A0ABW5DR08_9PROT
MTKRYHHGDLRAALLSAARDILAETGPDGFSLRDCARRAGVSHAAPAHHFGDAKGLLTAVATEGFEALSRAMQIKADTCGPDAADRLTALGEAYVEQAVTDPGAFRIMFRPALLHTEDPRLKQAADRARQVLQGGIEAIPSTKGGDAKTQQIRAILAWSTVHGLASLLLDGPLAREVGAPAKEIAGPLAKQVLGMLTLRIGA